MIRLTFTGLLLGILLAGSPRQALPPGPVSLSVPVAIAAKDGRIVRGLTPDQFTVRIGDEPAKVTGVVQGPGLAISVLLDLSGSMQGWFFPELRDAVRRVSESLRPHDVASINWFGARVVTDSTFGRGHQAVEDALKQIARDVRTPLAPSPLWDAMNGALTSLGRQAQRRVLIVWTDGRTTGNVVPFEVVMRHAVASGTTVIFLMPVSPLQPERFRWITDATGGFAAGLGAPRLRLKDAVRDLMERLQTDYLLRIEANVASGVHAVDVDVKAPELLVRAPVSVLAK